jgi:transposase
MGEIARGADGRRLFTPEFKKQQIERILRGELTLAELTRELDVSPSVTRRWKRFFEQGSSAAMGANEEVVAVRRLREAEQKIRELERALGRKTMEVEILQAAQEEVKKRPSWYGVSTR